MSMEKIVEESLGPEDKTQRSYEGRLGGVYGVILMSKRKLLFINEKGIFRKSYNLILALPYEKIKSLRTEGDYDLIIETEDLEHKFISNLRVQIVEEALVELMVQEPSKKF